MIGPDNREFDDVEAELRRQAYLQSRAPQPDCLDAAQVAAFVDHALDDDERRLVISHLAGCTGCRAWVQETTSLVMDEAVIRETPEHRDRTRRWSRIGAAAAAAVVLIAVGLMARPDDDPRLREPAVTATIAPTIVTPSGSVRRVDDLVWTSVPGAYQYRLRVQRADGSIVWSGQTADTLLRLPVSVRLTPGVRYSWRVEAQTEWQRAVASELTPFAIGTPRP